MIHYISTHETQHYYTQDTTPSNW